MSTQIYVIGGGRADDPRMCAHYDRILELAREKAGNDRPKIAMFPAAHRNGMHPDLPYRFFLAKYFRERSGGIEEILIGEVPGEDDESSDEDIERILNESTALYVLGGDTRYLLQVLRRRKLEPLFKEAFTKGLIFGGSSAGCIWLSKRAMSDSEYYDTPDEWSYIMVEGIGLIPFVMNVHDNQGVRAGVRPPVTRKIEFEERILSSSEQFALAIDEYVAVHIVDRELTVCSPSSEFGVTLIESTGDRLDRRRITETIDLEKEKICISF